VARRRALVNGVADRVRFLCAPIEKAPLADREFDIVWGTASCITFSTIGIWS
jgi:hypothetical protein